MHAHLVWCVSFASRVAFALMMKLAQAWHVDLLSLMLWVSCGLSSSPALMPPSPASV
jgi:hypothetical protein